MNNHYISKQQLQDALADYTAGDTTALALAAHVLGENICHYLKGKGLEYEAEEVQQEAVVAVLSKAKHAKSDLNLFSYFTTCILNHLRQLARGRLNYRRLLEQYSRDVLGSNGRPGQAVPQD